MDNFDLKKYLANNPLLSEIKVNDPTNIVSLWKNVEENIVKNLNRKTKGKSLLFIYNTELIQPTFQNSAGKDLMYSTSPNKPEYYERLLGFLSPQQKQEFYINLRNFQKENNF